MSPAQTAPPCIGWILRRCPRPGCGHAAPCAARCSRCAARLSNRVRWLWSRPAPSRNVRSHRRLEPSRPRLSPPSPSRPRRRRRGSSPRGQSPLEQQRRSRRLLPRDLLRPLLRPRRRALLRHRVQLPLGGRRLLLPCRLPRHQPPPHGLRLRPAPLRHRPRLPRLLLYRARRPGPRLVGARLTRFSPRTPLSRRAAWPGRSSPTWSSTTRVSGRRASATGT